MTTTDTTHRDRLASLERVALGTLAEQTMPSLSHEDGRAMLDHMAALVTLGAPRANDAERDDLTQIGLTLALALLTRESGWTIAEACRVAAWRVTRAANQGAAEQASDLPVDMSDADNADALDRLCTYRPEAPDAWTETTWTTAGNVALALAAREQGEHFPHAITAAQRTGGKGSAAFPKALALILAEAGEAALRTIDAERGQPSGGDYTHRADDAKANAAEALKARNEARKANRKPRTPAPGHRAPMPTSGPRSATVVRTADGATFVEWHQDDATGTPTRYRRAITPDEATAMLARTSGTGYQPTDADRSADAFAYATTPAGAVKQASGAKRKRDGGIGSPTIMRGPRQDWSSRTTKV